MPETERITVAWLQKHRACSSQVQKFERLYPDGLAATAANARAAHKQGLDVTWACCHLMTRTQRREFIVFTLRQRQPHLVTLFRRAELPEHAAVIEALTWDDLPQAQEVLAAARDAAWAAARDAAAWADADGADAARDARAEECIRILGLEEASHA